MDGSATGPQPSPLAASLDLVAEEIGELVELGERMQSVISRLAAAAPEVQTRPERGRGGWPPNGAGDPDSHHRAGTRRVAVRRVRHRAS